MTVVVANGVGPYVSLSAEGPGPTLWYTAEGFWSTDEERREVFTGVVQVNRTPILGLPSGYRPKLVWQQHEVIAQETVLWECDPLVPYEPE